MITCGSGLKDESKIALEKNLYTIPINLLNPLNHNKIWIYNEKTGWSMEDNKKEELMNDDQWEHFKAVWESYGVKFTHDDGTLKSAYEISKEMAQVFEALSDDKKEKNI